MTASARQALAVSWFDVTLYGAKGDGSTDDTAAIQAAIDAAEAKANGGTVFFPSGRYKITSTLTVQDDGIHLLGQGGMRYTTTDDFEYHGGACLFTNSAITLMRVGNLLGSGIFLQGGPIIERLHFEDTAPNTSTLLHIVRFNHGTITDCNFSKGLVGILFDRGTDDNDDASWWQLRQCHINHNTTGVKWTRPSGGAAVPSIEIAGGQMVVPPAGTGIHIASPGATHNRIHDIKLDLNAGSANTTGVFIEGGSNNTVSNVSIEYAGDGVGFKVYAGVNTLIGCRAVGVSASYGKGFLIDAASGHTDGVMLIGCSATTLTTGLQLGALARAAIVVGFNGRYCTQEIDFVSGTLKHVVLGVTTDDTGSATVNNTYAHQSTVLGVTTESGPGTGPLYREVTWDPGALASNGDTATTTVTIDGCRKGDVVFVGHDQIASAGALLTGTVTANDTVTVRLENQTGASLDVASGLLKVWTMRRAPL